MAGSSLLVLLDDIATLLDDIALMTKVAAKKTAGVLGDDLALNAEQVSGVRAERELPVVWAVAKGSIKNKLILVPSALAISAIAPWVVMPLLMVGGTYLCYEGFEKVAHKFFPAQHADREQHQEKLKAIADPAVDMVAFEEIKVKGAIRTDFILSLEIIVIALGTVKDTPLVTQIFVVSGIAAIVTVGVYGLVAAIVRLDDLGIYLVRSANGVQNSVKMILGRAMLVGAPYLMKTLTVVGTAAMFLVGGGILLHGIPGAHHLVQSVEHIVAGLPGAGGVLTALTPVVVNGVAGILLGAAAVFFSTMGQKAYRFVKPS
jgi:hypothetical protein